MPAAGTHDKFLAVRHALGGNGVFNTFPTTQRIAASQDIKKFDILSLDGSGDLAQSIALPGSNSTGTASGGNLPIAGIALCDIVTDASGNLTTPNQAGLSSNYGCPSVAMFTDLELMVRIYDGTATNTQQGDLVVGTAYQFQRWRDTAATIWWYELIITTTNGELEIVERAAAIAGTPTTDNYGLVWVRPILSSTVRQV